MSHPPDPISGGAPSATLQPPSPAQCSAPAASPRRTLHLTEDGPLPPAAPRGFAGRDVGLDHLARRLGRRHAAPATLVSLVRDLTDKKGFPPPLGFRRWKGRLVSGADAVCAKARWPLAAVDAWFDRHFPQHGLAESDVEQAEWAGRLDAAAMNLGVAA